jgi:hypothetical protein
MLDLFDFLTFFAAVVVVTYGITTSLLLTHLRGAIFQVLEPVKPLRRLWLMSALFCPVCVGTWVSAVGWGAWVPHPPAEYPLWSVALLIGLAAVGAMPSAAEEFGFFRDHIIRDLTADDTTPEKDA